MYQTKPHTFITGTTMFKPQSLHMYAISLLLLVMTPLVTIAQPIVDDEGQEISFAKPFSKIISLYPAHTENLASLGCDTELIGIGESDNYPEKFTSKPRFSYRDNTEKFLAAEPDLLLIRPMISRSQPELIEKLRAIGITIVSLQPTSIDQMFSYWQKLGDLCGRNDQAQKMAKKFSDDLTRQEALLPQNEKDRPGVYFESIHSKMKTFDPDAITMFALKIGGGNNIAVDASGRNDSNIAPYGKEKLLSKAEEIDVFLSQVGRMNRVSLTDIYSEPGFQLIKAIRTKSVCLIEEDIVSRPTMRLIDGIRQIHSCLYPNSPSATSMTTGNKPKPTIHITRQ